MSLSLACPCGARFEVEESFARQTVSCPDCQRTLQAPAVTHQPLRTSGWAVASLVLALVLAFTGIGTIIAVLLGIVALASIARHRDEVTGVGYAIFSIVWGIAFTGLFVVAIARGELFGVGDGIRERMMGDQVDRTGPLEVRRAKEGFVITRPSTRWGIAKPALAFTLVDNSDEFVLVNVAKDAYLDVSKEFIGARGLDSHRDDVLARFRDNGTDVRTASKPKPRLASLTVRHNKRLPTVDDVEQAELLLDVKVAGAWMTFLVRLIKHRDSDQVFMIRGWAQRRRFPEVEAEIQEALKSFRLLDP